MALYRVLANDVERAVEARSPQAAVAEVLGKKADLTQPSSQAQGALLYASTASISAPVVSVTWPVDRARIVLAETAKQPGRPFWVDPTTWKGSALTVLTGAPA